MKGGKVIFKMNYNLGKHHKNEGGDNHAYQEK